MNSLELYRKLIENCGTKEKIEKVILDFLSENLGENEYFNLASRNKCVCLRRLHADVSPIIFYFPIDENADNILFSLHYDIHAQTTAPNGIIKGNRIFEKDGKIFSTFGGADDLAGVASVLTGIVEATKNTRRKTNVTLLISGGEEYGSKGVSRLFDTYGSRIFYDLGTTKIDACVVVDINDRIGVYCTFGSALDLLKVKADDEKINTLAGEFEKEFGEKLRVKPFSDSQNKNEYYVKLRATDNREMKGKIAFVERFVEVYDQADLARPFDCRESAKGLIEKYIASAKKIGVEPKEFRNPFSFSDANVIADQLQVPCILVSSGAVDAHTENEFVYVDELNKNSLIIKEFLLG